MMKKYIFLFILISSFYNSSFAQETRQTIRITNINKTKGKLYIGWYEKPDTFRINEQAIFKKMILVTNENEIITEFKNIPNGTYAIAVFLDENDNYKLDRNMFGIPKEKYGFSNNILPLLRAATFEESKFELNQSEKQITIHLK